MTPPTASRTLPPGLPRAVEVTLAGLGLIALSPLLLGAATAVALTSPGPVLFRQTRAGVGGHPFTLLKLRSMHTHAGGRKLTVRGDTRITPVGRLLRKTKIDELPQLWNVLRGDMSFVGPRPEVLDYVDLENALWRRVLEARPGITDPVTLVLRSEEELLASLEGETQDFYERYLLPYKLYGYRDYLERRSAWRDLGIVTKTVLAILRPGHAVQPSAEEVRTAVEARAGDG